MRSFTFSLMFIQKRLQSTMWRFVIFFTLSSHSSERDPQDICFLINSSTSGMRLQLIEVTKNCSVVQITGGSLIGCATDQRINTNSILIFYIHDQRFFPLLITAPTDNSSCCIGKIANRNVFKHIFIERPTNYISTNQLFLQRQAIEKIMQQS